MSGMYTQSRRYQPISNKMRYKSTINGVVGESTNEITSNVVQSQVTTSYRSGSNVQGELSRAQKDVQSELLAQIETQNRRGVPGKNFTHDTGHPFSTERRRVILSHPNEFLSGAGGWFKGPLFSSAGSIPGNFIVPGAINTASYGPKAIAATSPLKSIADLSTSFAEVAREGFPKMVGTILDLKSKVNLARSLGSEYLNLQFGWFPIVRELDNIFKVVVNHKKFIDQFMRDEGRFVRRRLEFDPVRTSNIIVHPTSVTLDNVMNGNFGKVLFSDYVTNANPGTNRLGKVSITEKTYEKYVFSGAYTYYLPPLTGGFQDDTVYRVLDKLLGLRVTPEVLWNLTPWSWLVDWFVNVGDNFANASAIYDDGLVIRWGYLQRHYISERIHTFSGATLRNGYRGTFDCNFRLERKERVKATPFGFGLDPGVFTPQQWAILAALGMTKTPTSLR